jgi:hypothetical protein
VATLFFFHEESPGSSGEEAESLPQRGSEPDLRSGKVISMKELKDD